MAQCCMHVHRCGTSLQAAAAASATAGKYHRPAVRPPAPPPHAASLASPAPSPTCLHCSYLSGCSSGMLHLWQFGQPRALATYTPGGGPLGEWMLAGGSPSVEACWKCVPRLAEPYALPFPPRCTSCVNCPPPLLRLSAASPAVPGSELASINKSFSGLLSFSRSFKQSSAAPRWVAGLGSSRSSSSSDDRHQPTCSGSGSGGGSSSIPVPALPPCRLASIRSSTSTPCHRESPAGWPTGAERQPCALPPAGSASLLWGRAASSPRGASTPPTGAGPPLDLLLNGTVSCVLCVMRRRWMARCGRQ